MTASSSTPETTTSGSIPAWRNTLRRPGEADPSTTPGHRRMCVRSSRVTRCQLKIAYRSLSTGWPHRLSSCGPGSTGPPAARASTVDQRGELLVGGLALDDLDVVDADACGASMVIRVGH